MTIERTFQGAWRVSAIVAGRLVSRQYFGMSKRESVAEFRAETANL